MRPSEREKLLKEILPGENAADFERASLEHGLSCLRRQQRRGQLARASAVAAFACLTLAVFLKLRHPASGDGSQLASAPQPAQTAERIQFINDDELLALFPDRPVALIGKPGQQRLVFLDKTHGDPARAPF
jgi:hypothetical protein